MFKLCCCTEGNTGGHMVHREHCAIWGFHEGETQSHFLQLLLCCKLLSGIDNRPAYHSSSDTQNDEAQPVMQPRAPSLTTRASDIASGTSTIQEHRIFSTAPTCCQPHPIMALDRQWSRMHVNIYFSIHPLAMWK